MGYMPADCTLKRQNSHRVKGKAETCELNLVQKHPFASVWAALSVMINPQCQVEEVLTTLGYGVMVAQQILVLFV